MRWACFAPYGRGPRGGNHARVPHRHPDHARVRGPDMRRGRCPAHRAVGQGFGRSERSVPAGASCPAPGLPLLMQDDRHRDRGPAEDVAVLVALLVSAVALYLLAWLAAGSPFEQAPP